GAFGVPLLAARSKPWTPVAIVAVLWLSLPVGLLLAPGAYGLWAITGGIAQGGGFTAIFSIIARTAGSDAQTASASATVQGGGYLAGTAAARVRGHRLLCDHGTAGRPPSRSLPPWDSRRPRDPRLRRLDSEPAIGFGARDRIRSPEAPRRPSVSVSRLGAG